MPQRLLSWILTLGALFSLLQLLKEGLEQSPSEQLLLQSHQAQLREGSPPAFDLLDREGQPIKLAEFQGQLLLIHFFATWCSPCREEIPQLERLKARFPQGKLEILGVSQDKGWAELDTFFAKKGTNMRLGLDPGGRMAQRYGTEKLPETYVVDQEGELRLRLIDAQRWEEGRLYDYLRRLSRP